MPQITIDPGRIPPEVFTSEPVSFTPLPPKARKHGFVVLSLGWRSIFTQMWNRNWRPSFKAAVICSQVVYDAHAEITLGLLQGCPLRDVMPAHLSATSSLEDIYIPWVKLA